MRKRNLRERKDLPESHRAHKWKSWDSKSQGLETWSACPPLVAASRLSTTPTYPVYVPCPCVFPKFHLSSKSAYSLMRPETIPGHKIPSHYLEDVICLSPERFQGWFIDDFKPSSEFGLAYSRYFVNTDQSTSQFIYPFHQDLLFPCSG